MTEPFEDDWMDALRRSADDVRPVGDVVTPVRDGVRRRRRRRAGVGAAGAAAVVVVTAVAVAALPGSDRGAAPTPPVATERPPASDEPADPDPQAEFSCPMMSRVFDQTPPIPDLAEQQAVVDTLSRFSSIRVRHAEPTAMGVVALVDDTSGDTDHLAEPDVVDRLKRAGAAYVYEWDSIAADTDLDASGQVGRVLGWQVQPAVGEVRAAIRGVPGFSELAVWNDAGAILLNWKEPVPAEIEALEGQTFQGVRVLVDPVRYSHAEVRRAQARLQTWVEDSSLGREWSSSYACADGSGLVVGIRSRSAHRPGLAGEISDAVGMPVMVVPEDVAVALPGRVSR